MSDYKEYFKDLHIMTKEDIDKFANNLAVSFKGYPLFEYFAKNNYDIKKMNYFWKVSLRMCIKNSLCLSDSEDVKGVAVFSNGAQKDSIWDYIKNGGLLILPKMGLAAVKRMTKFEKFANGIKEKYANENCWYFYVFTVLPECRKKGIGSKILRKVFKFFDENQKDCYLETLTYENVGIYNRYGFELVETLNVPDSDLTMYAMYRKHKELKVEEEKTVEQTEKTL